MNNVWRAKKATRKDFGKIIGEIRIFLENILSFNPKNISQFYEIAVANGYTDPVC